MTEELESIITGELSLLAKERALETTQQQGALLSVQQQSVKIEHELSQYVQYAKRRCKEGFEYSIEAVSTLAKTDAAIDLEAFRANISEAFSRFETTARVLEMSAQAAQGTSWRVLLGLTDETMKWLYQGAKSLFDSGQFPEAEAAFFFLTTVDVSQHAFWLGLGHAAFRLGNLNQAINSYETADLCQPKAIWPHIYIANCFEAMNDFEESYRALEVANKECAEAASHGKQQAELEKSIQERVLKAKARL